MIGSGNPAPYDLLVFIALCLLALVLLVGAIIGLRWSSNGAAIVRYGSLILSFLIVTVVYWLWPTTNAFVGAGRLVTLWPAVAANVVFFLAWSWRIGHL